MLRLPCDAPAQHAIDNNFFDSGVATFRGTTQPQSYVFLYFLILQPIASPHQRDPIHGKAAMENPTVPATNPLPSQSQHRTTRLQYHTALAEIQQ